MTRSVVHVVSCLLLGLTVACRLAPVQPALAQATGSPSPVIAHLTPSYATGFPNTESPISEGGNWINGKTIGVDWTDVQTTTGKAFGTQSGNDANPFNDSTALLTGSWASDQAAQATVYVSSTPTRCCAEVELRLRSTMTAHNAGGYEFLCSTASSNPYMAIMVWPGALQANLEDYPQLAYRGDIGCVDGDVLAATAVGSTLTFFKNGDTVLTATDTTFPDGAPGVGLFLHNQSTGVIGSVVANLTGMSASYGFTNFAASGSRDLPGADTRSSR